MWDMRMYKGIRLMMALVVKKETRRGRDILGYVGV